MTKSKGIRDVQAAWTADDIATLRREYSGPESAWRLAAKLNRSIWGIRRKAKELDLIKPRRLRIARHYCTASNKEALAERLAERDARLYGHEPSLDEILMGTPPPGRSALDGWKQIGGPERPEPTEQWE